MTTETKLSDHDREFLKTQAKSLDYLFDQAEEWMHQMAPGAQHIAVVLNGMRSINQRIVRQFRLDVLVSGHTDG